MPLPPLTKRQREIVDFFQQYVHAHAISPTLEEIAQAMGVNKVTIFGHIAELERKGVLRKTARGISRALKLAPSMKTPAPAPRPSAIHVLGTIAAGRPIEALEVPEELDLADLAPKDREVYALRVRGDSMIEDAICSGDLVLIERRNHAHNGEIVVAVLPGEEATLKRYYREGSQIRLQPSNAAMTPILVPDVEIRGVVLGVIRRY